MTVFDRLGAEPVADWDAEAALHRVLDLCAELDKDAAGFSSADNKSSWWVGEAYRVSASRIRAAIIGADHV